MSAMASTGAIAGLGITEMGKIYGRTATEFAAEAIALALDDAGLVKSDVDGLLVNGNLSPEMNPNLQLDAGVRGPHAAQRDERVRVDAGHDAPVRVRRDRAGPGQRRRARVRRRAAAAGHLGRRRRTPPARACTGWAGSSTPTASTAPTPATPWRPNGT